MIISASRRSDIPAFSGRWFMNRLRAGTVLVRNPMNFSGVSRVSLRPKACGFRQGFDEAWKIINGKLCEKGVRL